MEALVFGNLTLDNNSINNKNIQSLGGSSFFISHFLTNMGIKVTLVSPAGLDFPKNRYKKIVFHPVKSLYKKNLIFKNIYANGKREQFVDNLTSSEFDFSGINNNFYKNKDILVIAPVLPNISQKEIMLIAKNFKGRLKVLLPQGLFRKITKKQKIIIQEKSISKKIISLFDLVVLSEIDHPNANKIAEIWGQGKTIIVVTRSEKPVTVYHNKKIFQFDAFRVDNIKDETGAGDIFSGAFAYAYLLTSDIYSSVYFAHSAAAMSLPLFSSELKYSKEEIIAFSRKRGQQINL